MLLWTLYNTMNNSRHLIRTISIFRNVCSRLFSINQLKCTRFLTVGGAWERAEMLQYTTVMLTLAFYGEESTDKQYLQSSQIFVFTLYLLFEWSVLFLYILFVIWKCYWTNLFILSTLYHSKSFSNYHDMNNSYVHMPNSDKVGNGQKNKIK